MEPDDKRLMAAHNAAVDAVADWAKTDQFYYSMKEKVQKYFNMHDQMVGATKPDDKLETRKLMVKLLAVELLYPMYNLNQSTVKKAVAELENIAEDIGQKPSRGFHR